MKKLYSYQSWCVLLAGLLLWSANFTHAQVTFAQHPLIAEQVASKENFSYKKPRKVDPFKKEQSKELLRATAQLGLGVGLIGSIYYLIGGPKPLDPSLIMGPLIGNMLSKPLGHIGNKLCLLFIPAFAKPGLRKAMDLRKR
jgi:hypothetical protein